MHNTGVSRDKEGLSEQDETRDMLLVQVALNSSWHGGLHSSITEQQLAHRAAIDCQWLCRHASVKCVQSKLRSKFGLECVVGDKGYKWPLWDGSAVPKWLTTVHAASGV